MRKRKWVGKKLEGQPYLYNILCDDDVVVLFFWKRKGNFGVGRGVASFLGKGRRQSPGGLGLGLWWSHHKNVVHLKVPCHLANLVSLRSVGAEVFVDLLVVK